VDAAAVDAWLERYIAAWRSGDRVEIADLFSEDASYRYHSYDEPVVGREAIAADWLEEPDEPGSWEAEYSCYAVDGGRAVAVGTSSYPREGKVYDNVFLLQFDGDGRCSDFTEWYVKRP
jgi:ketosteroid isomerase-like protein